MNKALRIWSGASLIGGWFLGATNLSYGQAVCQEARLTAFDGGPFQSFGRAVAVSGNKALIGACCIFAWPTYVFSFDPESGAWIETQLLIPSDLQPGEDTGRAVAIDGDVAMIAAGHLHEDETGVFYGAVFVFRYNGTLWVEEDELLASDSAFQDGFGVSVSFSGDVAVIGALLDDDNGANSGSAYVFRFDPDTLQWVEEQKLLASNGSAGDFFGTSVAVEGPLAVVGADGHPNNNITLGAAYVFGFDPDTSVWVQQQILQPSDDAGSARFGDSVSISGNLILVGAHSEGNGAAYVFRLDPKTSQWEMEQKFVASDPGGIDHFGRSVAIDGAPGNEIAVVGAWASNASSGAAYIYRFDSDASQWIEQAIALPEPNLWTNFFGWSVAIDGETAVIGAHGEDQQRGAAYVFDLAPNCNCPHDLDGDGNVGVPDLLALLASWGPCKGCPGDFDENGDVGVSDLLVMLANWGVCP